LAAELGVTQQALQKWIRKGYAPLLRVRAIEALTGVPRKELIDPRATELLQPVIENFDDVMQ